MSDERFLETARELAEMHDEPLRPELLPYVEESETWGQMLRHPLVYMVPFILPGMANRALEYKQQALIKAQDDGDWHTVVFLHERPYRLRALIDYVTGRDEDGDIIPLANVPAVHHDLVAAVWVDSENIEQNMDDWRALFRNGESIWIGTLEERAQFESLPTIEHINGPMIRAWRGGSVGDWSWTTDVEIARFFSRRSGLPVRGHLIPKADVFGYLTRRGESELLVKFTEFRRKLVYPVSVSGNEEVE